MTGEDPIKVSMEISSHWGDTRDDDVLPEFFWSDGDSCEGAPHDANDSAKTANSNANKRFISSSLNHAGEPIDLGPLDPRFIHVNSTEQQDPCRPLLCVLAAIRAEPGEKLELFRKCLRFPHNKASLGNSPDAAGVNNRLIATTTAGGRNLNQVLTIRCVNR